MHSCEGQYNIDFKNVLFCGVIKIIRMFLAASLTWINAGAETYLIFKLYVRFLTYKDLFWPENSFLDLHNISW